MILEYEETRQAITTYGLEDKGLEWNWRNRGTEEYWRA